MPLSKFITTILCFKRAENGREKENKREKKEMREKSFQVNANLFLKELAINKEILGL